MSRQVAFPSSTSSDLHIYNPICHVHRISSSLFASYAIEKEKVSLLDKKTKNDEDPETNNKKDLISNFK